MCPECSHGEDAFTVVTQAWREQRTARILAENVALAAEAVVDAADACDREAERHPSSRSSAPAVRAINAMSRLREALGAWKKPPA